jgi:hypothetical protein
MHGILLLFQQQQALIQIVSFALLCIISLFNVLLIVIMDMLNSFLVQTLE